MSFWHLSLRSDLTQSDLAGTIVFVTDLDHVSFAGHASCLDGFATFRTCVIIDALFIFVLNSGGHVILHLSLISILVRSSMDRLTDLILLSLIVEL